MRSFIAALVLMVAAQASASDAACDAVEENSRGHIECTRDDFGYTLKYDSWLARQATVTSGRYDDLISLLCFEGGIVREQWPVPFSDPKLKVTHCVAER